MIALLAARCLCQGIRLTFIFGCLMAIDAVCANAVIIIVCCTQTVRNNGSVQFVFRNTGCNLGTLHAEIHAALLNLLDYQRHRSLHNADEIVFPFCMQPSLPH